MATRNITAIDPALITALGGTVANTDSVYLDRYATQYSSADLSAYDLTLLHLTRGFGSELTAANGAQLKAVVDQSGAGVLLNEFAGKLLEVISTSSSGVIKTIINRPQEASATVRLNTMLVTNLLHLAGNLIVESAVNSTTAWVIFARAYFRYGSSAMTTLHVGNGGVATLERDVTDINVNGTGELLLNDTRVSPGGVTTLNGGTLKIGRTGTIASLAGSSGTLDLRECETPFTVSARAFGPGVTILRRRTDYMTVSINNDVYGGPKTIIVD